MNEWGKSILEGRCWIKRQSKDIQTPSYSPFHPWRYADPIHSPFSYPHFIPFFFAPNFDTHIYSLIIILFSTINIKLYSYLIWLYYKCWYRVNPTSPYTTYLAQSAKKLRKLILHSSPFSDKLNSNKRICCSSQGFSSIKNKSSTFPWICLEQSRSKIYNCNSTALLIFCISIILLNRAGYKISLSVTKPVFDRLCFYTFIILLNRAGHKIILSVTEPVFDSKHLTRAEQTSFLSDKSP